MAGTEPAILWGANTSIDTTDKAMGGGGRKESNFKKIPLNNSWNPEIQHHSYSHQTRIICEILVSGCLGLLTMRESLILNRWSLCGVCTSLICYCSAAFAKVPGLLDPRIVSTSIII